MNERLLLVSIDRLKVAFLPSLTMEHKQRSSTSTTLVDAINNNSIVLADKNQSNSVTGSNNVNCSLNSTFSLIPITLWV